MLYARASYIFWSFFVINQTATHINKRLQRGIVYIVPLPSIYNVQQLITHGGIEAGNVTWAGKLSGRISWSWWPAQ